MCGAVSYWDVALLLMLPVALWGMYKQLGFQDVRRRGLKRLLARDDANLASEYQKVMERGKIAQADVERLWLALAAFYGVPPAKLRTADRLKDELDGVTGHPDYDPCLTSLVLRHKVPAREALKTVTDWGGVLLAFHQIEREAGRLATKTVERDGVVRHEWAS